MRDEGEHGSASGVERYVGKKLADRYCVDVPRFIGGIVFKARSCTVQLCEFDQAGPIVAAVERFAKQGRVTWAIRGLELACCTVDGDERLLTYRLHG